MTAKYGNFAAPATEAVAIVLDVAFAQPSRAIYVGVAGDVSAVMAEGSKATILFKNCPAGSILPISATMCTTVAGTATNLVCIF